MTLSGMCFDARHMWFFACDLAVPLMHGVLMKGCNTPNSRQQGITIPVSLDKKT